MLSIILAAVVVAVLALGTLVILALFGVGWETRETNTAGNVERRFLPWIRPRESTLAVGPWAHALARRTAERFLRRGKSRKVAHEMTDEILTGVSHAVGLSETNARRDCEENCRTRRHEMIGVTAPEVLRLAEELLETRPPGEVERIRKLAAANAALSAVSDAVSYRRAKVTCPLLGGDEVCVAWGARPIHCRSWCLKGNGKSSDTASGEGSKTEPRLDATALSVGSGVSQGLAAALTDAGLDGTVYELNGALATALATPQAEERWLDGEPVFAGCRRCS